MASRANQLTMMQEISMKMDKHQREILSKLDEGFSEITQLIMDNTEVSSGAISSISVPPELSERAMNVQKPSVCEQNITDIRLPFRMHVTPCIFQTYVRPGHSRNTGCKSSTELVVG